MHDGSHSTESFARIEPKSAVPTQDPFLSLYELIEREGLRADVLACLGDIGDQANPQAAIAGWNRVREVGRRLECREVVATTGNHDIDSRRTYDEHDPSLTARFRLEAYPVQDEFSRYKYWAKNYCVLDLDDLSTRLVLLNTSSLHHDEKVARHGTVSNPTIAALENDLAAAATLSNSILICHHHPFRHGDLDIEDYSEIDNASSLVNLLDQRRPEPWCIVHGHKHLPRIAYAGTGNLPLTVFSAGSFSGPLYPEIRHVGNHFYILEFRPDDARALRLSTAVLFESWTWRFADGWTRANSSKIPARGGFGLRASTPQLVADVFDVFDSLGQPFLTWDEVLQVQPKLKFLAPRDLDDLVAALVLEGYGVLRDSGSNLPSQIGRSP